MAWWRFWEHDEASEQSREQPAQRTATVGTVPVPPAHRDPAPTAPAGDRTTHQLEHLRKRREGIRFDLERAEEANLPGNPWDERVALLTDTLAIVDADLAALDRFDRQTSIPMPPTPTAGIVVTNDAQVDVRFSIGGELFHFAEEIDWDERGGPEVRGDLRFQSGAIDRVVPDQVPSDRRDALIGHLTDSVQVFATDLRDRVLDGLPLPVSPTLADLARPCPVCGGWQDWRGNCNACTQRSWQRQQLRAEAERLRTEQTMEEEERHRWAERLPIARRRLADIDGDIANLESQ